jgi:hypothetical protein
MEEIRQLMLRAEGSLFNELFNPNHQSVTHKPLHNLDGIRCVWCDFLKHDPVEKLTLYHAGFDVHSS